MSDGYEIRKIILVSVKFLSAILGPEMGASISWWKNAFFLQENPMSIKFLVLRGGGVLGFGGGECRFYLYGRADFSDEKVVGSRFGDLSGPMRDTPRYRAISFREYRRGGYRTHMPCFHRVSRRYR